MALLNRLKRDVNGGWEPKPPKEPGADDRVKAIRLKVVGCVLGKLTKADAEEINDLIGDRPIAVWAKLARDFADQAAVTSDVKSSELLDLLSGGPAAALYKLASERKAAQEAFEQTAYSAKLRELTSAATAAGEAFAAVEHDEDVTPQKKRRLLQEWDEARIPPNTLMNSRDPDLVAYRNEMKKTADPSLNELKWENFAI